jgi:predicted DNA-binding transcriptional regulator YafY
MRRADRLFQIVQYLRSGRLVTARMLASRLEVSERTIYRDIADLQASRLCRILCVTRLLTQLGSGLRT